MPVILEKITELSPQDHQDLVKIYQKYPQTLGDNPELWINTTFVSGQILLAGRFNGRLVGSVWVTQSTTLDANTHQKPQINWQLHHLCVRDITRRRGVARQLLTLLSQKADKEGINLSIENTPDSTIIQPLLIELDFNLITPVSQGSLWQRKHQ